MIRPPGTILQHLYFKERLRNIRPGKFIEVGVGQGLLSKLLLDTGWQGIGFDLNADSIRGASQLNAASIARCRYELRCDDWLEAQPAEKVDMVVSCMVLEHLTEQDEEAYFRACENSLTDGGVMVLFVPGSPSHFGTEDKVAGHYRRYTAEGLRGKLEQHGWRDIHIAGLTYPVSNLLYPLSENMVRRAEAKKLDFSMAERTRLSGNRDVPFKTRFPSAFGLLLNDFSLYPLHVVQKCFLRHPNALVLYTEGTKRS